LHICCANCATVCIQRLRREGFSVAGLFYNPNIHPEQEYLRRKEDIEIISKELRLDIKEAVYDIDTWFNSIKGHEKDREGGARCGLCFMLRLKKTYDEMMRQSFDFFTTTLTISPLKNSGTVNEIGTSIGGERYLMRDFKKQDGFRESVEISKKLGLHRQHYCGCIFSKGGK